jgi:hypothetical protein
MAALKAAGSLEERLQSNPDSLVFSRVADLYRKAGKVDRAIDICQKGIKRNPEYVTGHLVLGRCYLQQKKQKEAAEAFSNVCRMDWRNLAAIRLLAGTMQEQGSPEKAGDLYSILLKLDPYDKLAGRKASRTEETGAVNLLEIIGETPSAVFPKTGRESTFVSEETVKFDKKNPVKKPAKAFEAAPLTAGTGSASEDMLSDATAISGSDITDRISSLFGEGLSIPKVNKTRSEPPPEKKLPGFEAHPYIDATTVTSDRADILGKDTIQMPVLKGSAQDGTSGEVEFEETMIMDASDAMILKGDSGIRIKDTGAPATPAPSAPEKKEADQILEQDRTQEILKDTFALQANVSAVDELAGKTPESLDDLISEMTKEESMEAPAKGPSAPVKTGRSAEDTISGDDVFARLDGIFMDKKKKHEKEPPVAKEQPVPKTGKGNAVASEFTETISIKKAELTEKNDKTATQPSPDDTISGDDVFARLEGIFTGGKKKKKEISPESAPKSADVPAVTHIDKKEETDTFTRDGTVSVEARVEDPDDKESVEARVEEPAGKKDLDISIDEGPEITAVEIPAPVMSSPFNAGADQSEGFEETLIFDTPGEISGTKKEHDKPPADREDTLSLSDTISITKIEAPTSKKDEDKPTADREDTLSLNDTISITKIEHPVSKKNDEGRESTAVFEDFAPGLAPEAPAAPPDVPAFEPKPDAPAVLDITANIDKEDNPDDLPDQVLSPTLANIYLEQGQPQFALKIYQRLAAKDPVNEDFQRQIRKLEKTIATGADAVRPHKPKRSKARKKISPARTRISARPDETKNILPLAGVRLRKKMRPKRKTSARRWK